MTQSSTDDIHAEMLKIIDIFLKKHAAGEDTRLQINELLALMTLVKVDEIRFDLERV